jgi:hypothetical protein
MPYWGGGGISCGCPAADRLQKLLGRPSVSPNGTPRAASVLTASGEAPEISHRKVRRSEGLNCSPRHSARNTASDCAGEWSSKRKSQFGSELTFPRSKKVSSVPNSLFFLREATWWPASAAPTGWNGCTFQQRGTHARASAKMPAASARSSSDGGIAFGSERRPRRPRDATAASAIWAADWQPKMRGIFGRLHVGSPIEIREGRTASTARSPPIDARARRRR